MEQSGIKQQLHHLRDSSSVVQINGDKPTAGFEIADHWDALPNAFKVVNAQINPSCASNRQQMQNGIGGTADRHDHADGVFEGLFCEQIERPDVGFHGIHQHLC